MFFYFNYNSYICIMEKDREILTSRIRNTIRKSNRKAKTFFGQCENEYVKFNYEIYGVSYNPYQEDWKLNVRVTDAVYFNSWGSSRDNTTHVKIGRGWRTVRSVNSDIRGLIQDEWAFFFCNTFGIMDWNFRMGNLKHIKS